MTEDLPDAASGTKGAVRAQMWAEAKARHDAGQIRAVEVRGSDYLGPDVTERTHPAWSRPKALTGQAGPGVR